MAYSKPSKFDAWSYSRLIEWEACPLKAKLHHLDKIKEPEGPALARGSAIHKLAEDYVLARCVEMPAELAKFKEEFEDLRSRKRSLEVEADAAVTKDWEPCNWDDWGTCWLRGKLDVLFFIGTTAYVVDHKTGKVHPENADQLDLYATVVMARRPDITVVEAALWYLDQGEVIQRAYTRALDFERLKKQWNKRVKPMLADKTFKPTPGNACRYCWYGQGSKRKGGPGNCTF